MLEISNKKRRTGKLIEGIFRVNLQGYNKKVSYCKIGLDVFSPRTIMIGNAEYRSSNRLRVKKR